MRIFILSVALLALASPASAATRNYTITGFTKIRVDGPYRVTLTTGVPPFARASGSQNGIDRVAAEMRGDTLVIHSSASWGGYPGADVGPVEIEVGTHELNSASLFGSGSLTISNVSGLSFTSSVLGSGLIEIGRVAVDQLSVSVEGSGSARLSGTAKRLTALVRGVSLLDAKALEVPTATISADGTSTVDANVTDSATVNGWGTATVRLAGRPSCIVRTNGSVSVSGCKSTQ